MVLKPVLFEYCRWLLRNQFVLSTGPDQGYAVRANFLTGSGCVIELLLEDQKNLFRKSLAAHPDINEFTDFLLQNRVRQYSLEDK